MRKASVRGHLRGASGSETPHHDKHDPAEELARLLSDQEPTVVMKATLKWAREHADEIEKIKAEVQDAVG